MKKALGLLLALTTSFAIACNDDKLKVSEYCIRECMDRTRDCVDTCYENVQGPLVCCDDCLEEDESCIWSCVY